MKMTLDHSMAALAHSQNLVGKMNPQQAQQPQEAQPQAGAPQPTPQAQAPQPTPGAQPTQKQPKADPNQTISELVAIIKQLVDEDKKENI